MKSASLQPAMSTDRIEEDDHQDQDIILAEEDIAEVIDDDGEVDQDWEDEEDGAVDAGEPLITDDPSEPKERPDNAVAGTFLHTPGSAIFTLALHPNFPNPPLAVSGGQDDVSFIFCPLTPRSNPGSSFTRNEFKPIRLTGHTDSVVSAAFSADGEYVATGGMDGRVRVWRHTRPKRGPTVDASPDSPDAWKHWEFLTSLEAGGEIQWLQWHPKGPVLAAGCEDASVWLWTLPTGRTMTVLSSHTLASTAGIFPPPNGKQLLTGSLDSTLVMWNPATSTPEIKLSIFSPPNARDVNPAVVGITALAMTPNGALAAVGGASGRIRMVAFRQGEVVDIPAEVVQTMEGHRRGESIEALAFVDLLQGTAGGKGVVLLSAGTDGRFITWDSTTSRVRADMRHPEAITSFAVHPAPNQHLATTACGDRTLRTWDVRTGTLLAEHVGHAGPVNSVAVAPAPPGTESPLGLKEAQLIISGGDEGASLVWKV